MSSFSCQTFVWSPLARYTRRFTCPFSLMSIITICFLLGFEAARGDQPNQGIVQVGAQPPEAPGLYDAPIVSNIPCSGLLLEWIDVPWVAPDAGVKETTGLLIVLQGIGYSNCNPSVPIVPDINWPNTKDIVVAAVYYRSIAYRFPYDFGKYQITDVLRGVGGMLDAFPQLDTRRLYLYGESGGGHLGLQVLQASRHLWAEVHLHASITRITTLQDVVHNGYRTRWNVNLGFPESQGALSNHDWLRFSAERTLRSPQHHVLYDPPWMPNAHDDPKVWMFHGTADTTVSFQHFLDYKQHMFIATGIEPEVVSETHEQSGNWSFITIQNGNHAYNGAAPWENTRHGASNHHVPQAFTRHRATHPDPAIDYVFPAVHDRTYYLYGQTLLESTLETVVPLSTGHSWELYK